MDKPALGSDHSEVSHFRINPDHNIQMLRIGESQTPILIIDDYLQTVEDLIEYAARRTTFSPDKTTFYPGIRSALPKAYVVASLKPLMKGLYRLFDIPIGLSPTPIDNYFSLITLPPEELTPMQTLPHYDTPDPNLIAVVHYLSPNQHGGTGFYRHNRSRTERVTSKNEQAYLYEAQSFAKKGYPKAYCDTSHPAYTCFYQVPFKQNRIVLYPGNLLHSALITTSKDTKADPKQGRLTSNMFIKFS